MLISAELKEEFPKAFQLQIDCFPPFFKILSPFALLVRRLHCCRYIVSNPTSRLHFVPALG